MVDRTRKPCGVAVLQPQTQTIIMPDPSRPRRLGGSYMTNMRGKWRHVPPIYKWPSIWALIIAFALQFGLGIFPTFLSFVALAAADERRCPVAIGGERMLPFYFWFAGVCIGIGCCTHMSTGRNASNDWVFWGAMAEVYRYIDLRQAGLR